MSELPKAYNPADHEDALYQRWEESGAFQPSDGTSGETFSIALPPPNVTGTLHLGHAFEHTLQDIMVRYHRMRGDRTLWVPGTDHAAIATQARYEKDLQKKEGKSRHDFSREDFFNQVQEFALGNQQTILNQLKKMGDSIDWSRLAFTLDAKRELAVRTAFTRMYDQGLIYRGYRIVNWDPKGQTTISDDEVVHEEASGKLYTFRYSKDFPIPIATTRPETKVGDVAVAVHPDDKRYAAYIGKTYQLDFVGVPLEIRVVGDEAVDLAYGTGAVGVTPAHSLIDWEIAERHGLPFKKVINEYARIENASEELNGKKVLEARELIVEKLRAAGLLEDEKTITNNIAKAERTGGIVEPLPKLQWFIDVDKPFVLEHSKIDGIPSGSQTTLKDIMRLAVTKGAITILPNHFEKIYLHWVTNLRDWCISRQILYGHRVPVWYREQIANSPDAKVGIPLRRDKEQREEQQETYVGVEAPTGEGWTQDEDTLDTWFSSGLWTFSTLGWPDETTDLANFHPTTIINPGYEILSLWVSRMVMMSGYLLGDIPFRTALFHGIVRDKDGRKFSKSLNNGIDPLEVIEKYGTDALRMALVVGVAPGSDVKFDFDKVKAYQHFANKIWNIGRYILINLEGIKNQELGIRNSNHLVGVTDADKEILDKVDRLVRDTTDNLTNYRFHLASEALYEFVWHQFADVYVEQAKTQLADDKLAANTRAILVHVYETSLKLLHPFMPFVTEAMWQNMPSSQAEPLLISAAWPTPGKDIRES